MIDGLRFVLADLQDLASLVELAARSDPHAWSAAAIHSTIVSCTESQSKTTELTRTSVWLCRDGAGDLIGFAAFRAMFDEAELLYVVVDLSQQGCGMGRAIVQFGLQEMVVAGARQCFLEVRKSHQRAQNLYAGLGFCVVGERKGYYPMAPNGREDALLMRCALCAEKELL